MLRDIRRRLLILVGFIVASFGMDMYLHRSFSPPDLIGKSLTIGFAGFALWSIYEAGQRWRLRRR